VEELITQLKAARAVSTPVLAVTTPDQPALTQVIIERLNGENPIVKWDRARGLTAGNDEGQKALGHLCKKFEELEPSNLEVATADPAAMVRFVYHLQPHTILVAQSFNMFLNQHDSAETIQGVLNLRDVYKGDQRTFIMTSPDFNLPAEIQHDVILLDDPLPDEEQYGSIVTGESGLFASAGLKEPSKEQVKKMTRSVRGLPHFEAEQVLAMSLAMGDGTGIDLTDAWNLKIQAVSKVKGLSMTFNDPEAPPLTDLKGLDSIISRLNKLQAGPCPPELYVRVDEIDKMMAGLGEGGGPGDSTGVSQDLHEQFLVNMEDHGWTGFILVGIRGSGKTVLTQSIGKAHGVPTIAMDTGAMKGRHVGDSEQAFRDGFRTIRSIGGKRVCVLATCNRLNALPPELLRRFKLGIYYFDLLTKEERDALWPVYLKKYGHPLDAKRPDDENWTGSEIRNCCEIAWMTGDTIDEVGTHGIVPVMVSDKNGVEALRMQANGNFLSASYKGKYQRSRIAAATKTAGRKLNIKGKGN
jgi:hypothetical protein